MTKNSLDFQDYLKFISTDYAMSFESQTDENIYNPVKKENDPHMNKNDSSKGFSVNKDKKQERKCKNEIIDDNYNPQSDENNLSIEKKETDIAHRNESLQVPNHLSASIDKKQKEECKNEIIGDEIYEINENIFSLVNNENHHNTQNDSLNDFYTFPGGKQKIRCKKLQGVKKPRGKSDIKLYKCKVCKSIFDTKKEKVLHFKTFHDAIKSFNCSECNAKYKSRQGLSDHKTLVHEKKKPYKCKLCDQGFTRESGIKIHIASVHEGKKPNICHICSTGFSLKTSLKIHIGAVHEGKKPFQCNFCGKGSKTKGHLEQHIATVHEKKKPFKCEFCGYDFITKCHLQRHISAVHEKRKMHSCHICGLSFAANYNLKAHIRVVHEKIKR
jgi:transcription elongation factor Elf1